MTRTTKLARFLLAASVAGTLVGACSTTAIPAITVNSITAESTIGTLTPPSGTYFAKVSVTMLNNTITPYSAWSYYYQLATMSDLGLGAPSDANAAVDTPCTYDVTVGPDGGTYTCNIVFEVPCGQVPYSLIYTLTDSVALTPSFTPPANCSTSSGSSSSSSGAGGGSSSTSTSSSSASSGAGGSSSSNSTSSSTSTSSNSSSGI